MASKPILYGTYYNPAVGAVMLALKALNVNYEFQEVRPLKKENQTPEYLRKNPTGTIPTLETEDHQFIGDSHSIIAYLADHYGKYDDSLYPKDLYKRAKVHQLQHFANSVFMSCVKPAYAPILARLSTTVPEDILKLIDATLLMMERFLEQNRWVAGDDLTIADFSCLCYMSTLHRLRPFTRESHPQSTDWFERMLAIPYVQETVSIAPGVSTQRFLEKQISKI